MDDNLTAEEKKLLLGVARSALEHAVRGEKLDPLDMKNMTAPLREDGASFITLTIHGDLRGCIGALEPYQPLVRDVQEHAVAAGLDDYRFPPVGERELDLINIEISRLTMPKKLAYSGADDLLAKLHPPTDGVILRDGQRRSTFLPQVWEKLPDKEMFLDELCRKMGAPADMWRIKPLEVMIYRVEEFHE
jgi:AmmeMemoRadiSam system protein A